jgi:hypothetical protein
MGTNYIFKFAGDGAALVLDDADYLSDAQRIIGHQPGIARANFANKAAKQSSFIAEAVAKFIVDYANVDVQDDQPASLVVTNFVSALLNAMGIYGSRRINKTQAVSPYAVVAADLDGMATFTNTGATGETVFNLPVGADGYKFSAEVTAAQYLKLVANGTEKIRFLGTQSGVGGYVKCNIIGNVISGEWSGTEWIITGIGGPWIYLK